MAGKSDYLEDAVLNHVLRNTALTSPATVYVGLYTAAPTDAGGGTEVSGGSYARQAVTFGAPSTSGGGRQVANSADVTFPAATANWGTVTHWGIFDASSAGNLLYWGALGASQVVNTGGQVRFPSGQLIVNED